MAVTDPGGVPHSGGGGTNSSAPAGDRAPAPGRGVAFRVHERRTFVYRVLRGIVRGFLVLWFHPTVSGREQVPASAAAILAPVHRSFLDFAFAVMVTDRKVFFMAKDSLWRSRFLGRLLVTLGAFPVHRESADREAVRHAEEVLRQGQLLVLFPEGARQEGPEVRPLLEGATFLAARVGAPVVPLGIGGSDRAMPKGRRFPKPVRVHLVVGEPMPAPARSAGGRVSRSGVHAATEDLRGRIQIVYDRSRQAAG